MRIHIEKPKVALVYPPYGPPNLASLGLANIQAGIKARGFECRTFYWAYQWMQQLPVAEEKKRAFYYMLTQRNLSPWNEWVFSRHAFADEMRAKDAEALAGLRALDAELPVYTAPALPSAVLSWMCNNMDALLEPMIAQLAPYDVVGVSTTFFQNGAALALCKAVKKRWPEKLTMLGGANCDGEMGRALMDNFAFIDCVFSGEVDFDVPEFVQRLHAGSGFDGVRGLIWRTDDGAVVETAPSEPVKNMDELPQPDFDDWVAERKRYGLYDSEHVCIPLESSRGCWWGAKHHCTFCGLNANGMSYRQKSPETFQREVSSIVERYDARYFFMADNILSTEYHKTFLAWARAQGLDVEFFYEIKANLTREQVKNLADSGVRMVQPGIEHFSSDVLKLMRKGVKSIQNVAFLKYAAENGIITIYSILAGFPGEDPWEYERLAREMPKLVHLRPPSALMDIEFHRFSPYHNNPEQFGVRLRPHRKYEMIFPVPERELARLAYQFVLVGRRTEDLSYLAGASRAVQEWRDAYRDEACTLTWQWSGEDILIEDRRPGFTSRDVRVQGDARAVFLELESPMSLPRVVERAQAARVEPGPSARRRGDGAVETVVSFSHEAFRADPRGALEPLRAAGLLWEEGGLVLNLPIIQTRAPTTTVWNSVQVP
jgi:ribosomal peptide maturation radical SAM protein 1